MKSKLVLVCLLLVAVALVVSAITASARPFSPGFMVKTMADGSKVTISMAGSDEWIKIGHTVDGLTVLPDDKGNFFYATLDKKGDLVASNVKANDPAKRGAAEKAFAAKLAKGLKFTAAQMKGKTPPKPQSYWAMNTYTGNVRLLAIAMYFKNFNWTLSMTTLTNMLNQHGYQSPISGQTGSFHEYMESQSGGLLNITTDVVGPFKAKNNWAYYGGTRGAYGDAHAPALYDEALVKADPTVNFALYDNDSNGTVDPCMMVTAGYSETEGADSNWIGAHTWTLAGDYPWGLPARTVDGKTAMMYCTWSEYRGTGGGTQISSVSNATHEYAHCMDRPDTYLWGIAPNCYDQMAMGSWAGGDGDNPSSYIAWHKIAWGWVTPTTLSSAATGVTIANRNDNRVAKRVDAAAGGEYFLLENVKVVGWDAYCYNSGMLVTHIAAAGHMEPADNSASCNSGQAGDVFPGTGNYTSYTDTTTPNMKSSGGVNTAKPITNITYPSYVTTFDFMQ